MAKKELGQVWTPTWLVDRILDEIGYTVDNPKILNARVMEPSFGEGVFLSGLIQRLIEACRRAGIRNEAISVRIANNIWGIERDPDVYDATVTAINALLAAQNIPTPRWHLANQDTLVYRNEVTFDYIVGNPPYIRVHNMDQALRDSVKRFAHATGTTDLYVIFFEACLPWLRPTGTLAFITPNSFMRNNSQKRFRAHLLGDKLLRKLIDFGARRVFADAATYTAITILDRKPKTTFTYMQEDTQPYTRDIRYADIGEPGAALVYPDAADASLLRDIAARPRRLGDLIAVQYGVCTLRDKIYLGAPAVEPALLRPVVKIPTYRGQPVTENILFPYVGDGADIHTLPEADLVNNYPLAHAYLLAHKAELLTRDIDRGASWYAYGRNQGLRAMAQRKLVVGHVVAQDQTRLRAYIVDARTIVYSGMFLSEIPAGLSLEATLTLLTSEEFCRFVKIHGKHMSGGYRTFTPKILREYRLQ